MKKSQGNFHFNNVTQWSWIKTRHFYFLYIKKKSMVETKNKIEIKQRRFNTIKKKKKNK